MAWEFDVVAVSAGLFTALGVGLKSAWDRFWSRRDRQEERQEVRDDLHRTELRQAYGELIASFHKMVDHGFALANVFEEHNAVRERTLAAEQAASIQQLYGAIPRPTSTAELQDVDHRAKAVKRSFFDGLTDVLSKATAVRLLDEDTQRGTKVWNVASDPVPPLEQREHAEAFRAELRLRRERFDALIADLGGAFAPHRWNRRSTRQQVSSSASPQITAGGSMPGRE